MRAAASSAAAADFPSAAELWGRPGLPAPRIPRAGGDGNLHGAGSCGLAARIPAPAPFVGILHRTGQENGCRVIDFTAGRCLHCRKQAGSARIPVPRLGAAGNVLDTCSGLPALFAGRGHRRDRPLRLPAAGSQAALFCRPGFRQNGALPIGAAVWAAPPPDRTSGFAQ